MNCAGAGVETQAARKSRGRIECRLNRRLSRYRANQLEGDGNDDDTDSPASARGMHQIGQIYVRAYEIELAASGRSRRTVDGLRQHFRKRDGAASCAQTICAIPEVLSEAINGPS